MECTKVKRCSKSDQKDKIQVTYVASANRVVIPEYLLQPPVFHPANPVSVIVIPLTTVIVIVINIILIANVMNNHHLYHDHNYNHRQVNLNLGGLGVMIARAIVDAVAGHGAVFTAAGRLLGEHLDFCLRNIFMTSLYLN